MLCDDDGVADKFDGEILSASEPKVSQGAIQAGLLNTELAVIEAENNLTWGRSGDCRCRGGSQFPWKADVVSVEGGGGGPNARKYGT